MKEEILSLRKLRYSYDQISNLLGCSKSTISYHCNKNNINIENLNKIDVDIINSIIEDRNNSNLTVLEIAKKYNVSISTVKRYNSKKILNINYCLNCGNETNNLKFCSNGCSSEYLHKNAYKKFLENSDKYCVGNYTAKNFKDFILKEQDDKCSICGNEPIWMGKELVFVLDHIDGDASNNKRENLRLICPNCDSQTSTFKSKTKNSKRRNYYREKTIKSINGGVAESGLLRLS